jgi:hypothetical protein
MAPYLFSLPETVSGRHELPARAAFENRAGICGSLGLILGVRIAVFRNVLTGKNV